MGSVTVYDQVQLTDYYPFGQVRQNNLAGSFDSRKKYATHELDDETGFDYVKARYYLGDRGRFESQDPEFWLTSEEWLSDPQNQNAYAYARNNPIILSDANGKNAIGNLMQSIKSVWNNFLSNRSITYQASTNSLPVSIPQASNNNIQKTTTWDLVTDQRISQLDPRVQQPATNFINQTERNLGVQLRVTTGYRSIEEQNRLYQQGRTTFGQIVTWAKGGESYHNYGLAFDVVRMENGKADWTPVSPEIAGIAKQQGFTWGGDWAVPKTDYPHFQMTFGKSWQELFKTSQ